CLAATAQLSEALKNPGAAAPVLGSADDEQATWISPVVHLQALIPDRGAAPGARSTRRYAQSIRGYFGLLPAIRCRGCHAERGSCGERGGRPEPHAAGTIRRAAAAMGWSRLRQRQKRCR